jgi:hypothetical protein
MCSCFDGPSEGSKYLQVVIRAREAAKSGVQVREAEGLVVLARPGQRDHEGALVCSHIAGRGGRTGERKRLKEDSKEEGYSWGQRRSAGRLTGVRKAASPIHSERNPRVTQVLKDTATVISSAACE